MPRYLVERTFDPMTDDELHEVLVLSQETAAVRFPDVTWEHSHMVRQDSGLVRSYCVYAAPSREDVLAHAAAMGGHAVDTIYEITGDIGPEDFSAGA